MENGKWFCYLINIVIWLEFDIIGKYLARLTELS